MRSISLTRRSLFAAWTSLIAVAAFPQILAAQAAKPKIGFIGAGRLGSALAKLWAGAGYQVMLSARNLDPVKQVAAGIGPNAHVGTPAEAAAWGDVVVVTVPYAALPQVGKDYADQLKGKIVLDTCNFNLQRDGDMAKLASEKGTGIADALYLPGTRLVRAFNTIGAGQLIPNSHRPGELLGVPVAADDKEALAVVTRLVRDAGFDPVIVGGLATAKSFDDYKSVQGTGNEVRAKLHLKCEPAPRRSDC